MQARACAEPRRRLKLWERDSAVVPTNASVQEWRDKARATRRSKNLAAKTRPPPAAFHRRLSAAPERRMRPHFGAPDLIQTNTEKYFLQASVFVRHASGDSGEAEEQIEMILTKAVVAKRRVWISSVLFAEPRPQCLSPDASPLFSN
jgi:hypothetical protein